jgi:DNA-directed RNA polymerase specialized sigma24 family protein
MEGDQAAAEAGFEELYQAHFGSIYDFSIRLAQDRNAAALVVQSVFLRALRAFRSGQGDGLELQLYTAAHLDTAERLRGSRGDTEQVEEPYAAVDVSRLATPTQDVVEMGRLVWSAAGALKLNDYELLDLSVRHKLDNNDIANVLRGRPETVERKLKDAQAQLEQAFTARLLFAQGRRECLDLDFDLGDAEWSKSLPRRILRHGQSCEMCKATIASQPTAIELLGALMPVPAPAGWQQTMLDRLKEAVRDEPVAPAAAAAGALATGAAMAKRTSAADQPEAKAASEQSELNPLPEGGGAIGGFALGAWLSSTFGDGGPRGPLLALLLGGLLMFVIVFGAVCVAGTFGGDGDEEETPASTRTATMTPTAGASGTPTVTRTPTETATLELVPQPTVPSVPEVPTQAPPPTSPPAPPPTAPPAPTAPPPPTATTAPIPPTLPAPTEVPPAPTP